MAVDAVVNVDVLNPNHMHSFQRSEKSIAILFESVLGFPVEVRASLASLPETSVSRLYKPAPTCQGEQHRIIEKHSINGCYKDDEDLLLKTPTLQAQQRVFQKQSINGCYQESNHPPTSGSFCPLMHPKAYLLFLFIYFVTRLGDTKRMLDYHIFLCS